jgi:hypothetical protein
MPQGSPGTESQNSVAYDVILVKSDGATKVYAHQEPVKNEKLGKLRSLAAQELQL